MKNDFINLLYEKNYICTTKDTILFPGILLKQISFVGNGFSVKYKTNENNMVITYCNRGQIRYEIEDDEFIHLESGNFFVHSKKTSSAYNVNLQSHNYEGMMIFVDLDEIINNPTNFFKEIDIDIKKLYNNILKNDSKGNFYSGDNKTQSIFKYFYLKNEGVNIVYKKIKIIELLLYLYQSDKFTNKYVNNYNNNQIDIIKKIHEKLLNSLDKRITIEELSKEYLINPTTLKEMFKAVYGKSIAAHMKEHRMKEAANMLLNTDLSIAQIALAVGYNSQSKFSIAFKEFYSVLPREYRKTN